MVTVQPNGITWLVIPPLTFLITDIRWTSRVCEKIGYELSDIWRHHYFFGYVSACTCTAYIHISIIINNDWYGTIPICDGLVWARTLDENDWNLGCVSKSSDQKTQWRTGKLRPCFGFQKIPDLDGPWFLSKTAEGRGKHSEKRKRHGRLTWIHFTRNTTSSSPLSHSLIRNFTLMSSCAFISVNDITLI